MIKEKVSRLIFEDCKRTAVGILVFCEETDKVLLLKRNVAPHKGKWSILSGAVDKGVYK